MAIEKDALCGIYNCCDDQPLLLQDFLDTLAVHWNYRKPWRLPPWCFYAAAVVCEAFATIFHTATPLTWDIVRMGMTSVVADTSRLRREIISILIYPTLQEGLPIL